MLRIALMSDNHGYIGKDIFDNLSDVDEIWHAGDMGNLESIDALKSYGALKGVYGNIDDAVTRSEYPLDLVWKVGKIKFLMTHIGGYPGKYKSKAADLILKEKPNVFICGHSHICKVIPDRINDLLHLNPGAYGFHGFHQMRTFLKFDINNDKICNMRVIELGLRMNQI
jgi:putative phosphoesterase